MEQSGKLNTGFWIHAFITSLAWVGPFLFNWKLMLIAYLLVFLQHTFLGKCILNGTHGTAEKDFNTFYSFVFEVLGFRPNRKRLHFVARKVLMPVLSLFTVFWQVYLQFPALLF